MVKTKKKPAAKKTAKKILKKAKKVAPIPKGYHSITPYFVVNGGIKAIEFYKKAFGAKVKECMPSMTKEEGKVGHAELQIGDSMFMLGDECPQMDAFAPQAGQHQSLSIYLYMKDVDAVVERAVAVGAKVIRPAEDAFYGDRTAGIEDPFGHRWYIATHIEDVSPAEIKKRVAAMKGCHEKCEHKDSM